MIDIDTYDVQSVSGRAIPGGLELVCTSWISSSKLYTHCVQTGEWHGGILYESNHRQGESSAK